MKRLIDANELKEHLFVGADYDKAINDGIDKTEEEVFAFKCGWNDALKSVMQFAPTVEVVAKSETTTEVVRCKDCRFFHRYGFKLEYAECVNFDFYDTTEDGYCCWAERREDGKTD